MALTGAQKEKIYGKENEFPHGSWLCAWCETRNSTDIKICGVCMMPHGSNKFPVTAPTYGLKDVQVTGNNWKCASCCTINANELERCECCLREKGHTISTDSPVSRMLAAGGTDPKQFTSTGAENTGSQEDQGYEQSS